MYNIHTRTRTRVYLKIVSDIYIYVFETFARSIKRYKSSSRRERRRNRYYSPSSLAAPNPFLVVVVVVAVTRTLVKRVR